MADGANCGSASEPGCSVVEEIHMVGMMASFVGCVGDRGSGAKLTGVCV